MSRVVDILDQYNNFTAQDKKSLDIFFGGIATDARTLAHQSGSRGSGYAIKTGNTEISWEEGISLFHPETGEKTVWLDPDGDALFGWDVETPGNTALVIFSNAQSYNGNTYGKGDLLLGDDSDAKANMLWDYSEGKLYFRSGTTVSVTIGDGGIVAEWGSIGGWTIAAQTLYSDSIILDSTGSASKITAGTIELDGEAETFAVGGGLNFKGSSETLTIGSELPTIVVDGSNKVIKSSNFSSEAAGFQLDAVNGDAEFNNIVARGTFRTSVFQFENLSAVGGHLLVSKSAAEVATDVATDTTFTLVLKNDDVGAVLVASGDILEIKGWNGTELIDVYVTAGTVTDQGATASFTATLQSGGTAKLLQRGMACANLGPSGAGTIRLQAGDLGDAAIPTRMSIQTHAGSPWSAWTNQVVIGDLYNTYDAGTNHRYGIGIGDFSGGNFLSYNADGSGGFVVKGGGGDVLINEDGVALTADTNEYPAQSNRIRWVNGSDEYLFVGSSLYSGDILSRLWSNTETINADSILYLGSSGKDGYDTETTIWNANTGDASFSAIQLKWDDSVNKHSIEMQSDSISILAGGLNITLGDLSLATGGISASGTTKLGDVLRVEQGTSTVPGRTGDGVEIQHDGTTGRVLSYNRSPGSDTPLQLRGSKVTLNEAGTDVLTVDGGDVYSNAFADYYSSSTKVGFSSITIGEIYYKTIGDFVYVTYYFSGVSNSTSTSFTLPYTPKTSLNHVGHIPNRSLNAGTWAMGFADVRTGTNVCILYRNAAANNWATSGTKTILGQFFYQRA